LLLNLVTLYYYLKDSLLWRDFAGDFDTKLAHLVMKKM
jgi:hypothetical protein